MKNNNKKTSIYDIEDELKYSSYNDNKIFSSKNIKIAIFLFLFYLLISSNIWVNNVLKKFNLTDNTDYIKLSGFIFNGIVLIIFYFILNILIKNNCI